MNDSLTGEGSSESVSAESGDESPVHSEVDITVPVAEPEYHEPAFPLKDDPEASGDALIHERKDSISDFGSRVLDGSIETGLLKRRFQIFHELVHTNPALIVGMICFLVLFVAYFISSFGVIVWLSTSLSKNNDVSSYQTPLKHVIFVIPDGFGPNAPVFAREVPHDTEGLSAFDEHLVGTSRTRSSSSYVTDSAAGGTALACGQRTNNGYISVTPSNEPIGSLLEAAKNSGKGVGVVVKSRISHATPAVFTAHLQDRFDEQNIAEQQFNSPFGNFDLMFGGGEDYLLPVPEGKRTDGKNIESLAVSKGYQVIHNRTELEEGMASGSLSLPLLGLFASSHMSYDIDHFFPVHSPAPVNGGGLGSVDVDGREPTLWAMTSAAITLLSNSYSEFFMMVECSEIDFAAHDNDPAAMVHEVFGCQKTLDAIFSAPELDFSSTLVVVVADHATGGLSLGRELNGVSDMDWSPQHLAEVNASAVYIAALMQEEIGSGCPNIRSIFARNTGALNLTDDEVSEMKILCNDSTAHLDLSVRVADAVSERVRLGWTSRSHVGVDVNVYAVGPEESVSPLKGNHKNVDIGKIVADRFGLDLDAATARLRESMSARRSHTPARRETQQSGQRFHSHD